MAALIGGTTRYSTNGGAGFGRPAPVTPPAGTALIGAPRAIPLPVAPTPIYRTPTAPVTSTVPIPAPVLPQPRPILTPVIAGPAPSVPITHPILGSTGSLPSTLPTPPSQTSTPISPISSAPISTSIFQPTQTPSAVGSGALPGTVDFGSGPALPVVSPGGSATGGGGVDLTSFTGSSDNTFWLILIVLAVLILWAGSE